MRPWPTWLAWHTQAIGHTRAAQKWQQHGNDKNLMQVFDGRGRCLVVGCHPMWESIPPSRLGRQILSYRSPSAVRGAVLLGFPTTRAPSLSPESPLLHERLHELPLPLVHQVHGSHHSHL